MLLMDGFPELDASSDTPFRDQLDKLDAVQSKLGRLVQGIMAKNLWLDDKLPRVPRVGYAATRMVALTFFRNHGS